MKEISDIDCIKCAHSQICQYKQAFEEIWAQILKADKNINVMDDMFIIQMSCKQFMDWRKK